MKALARPYRCGSAHAMLAAMSTLVLPGAASYADRINFLIELAERLHRYGTTAQRLEGANPLGVNPRDESSAEVLPFPPRPGTGDSTPSV